MTDFKAGCIAAAIAAVVLFICITVGCIHNDTMTRDKVVACAEAGQQWMDREVHPMTHNPKQTLLNLEQSERFQLALAGRLGLDPSLITQRGFLLEVGYDDPDMVRVTWEGLASLPVFEVSTMIQEAQR